MIKRVGTVSIFVEDQDRAKAFYTETLGMELISDDELWPGADARWLSVAPAGAETLITLYKFDENWEHYRSTFKQSQSLTLQCDDIDETYRLYKERGVEFLGEPETQFWGRFVMMKDCEGNTLILVSDLMTEDLLALSGRVGAALTQQGAWVCAAESCTGGLILSALTDCAGSSAYVQGGIVTYSNDAKMNFLKVREATLIEHGAVSQATAAEMARGALALFDVDYALSVTGIAGPGGGTADKPVGLTYIGLAGPDDLLRVERRVWDGDRVENKVASAAAALRLLLQNLALRQARPV